MKDYKRTFPITDTFMNYKLNDIIYGFMRCESTVEPVYDAYGNQIKGNEYIPRTKITANKKKLAELCGCTTRTIDNHIKKMLEAGLIAEPTEEEAKSMGFRYYFFPFRREDKYTTLRLEVLKKVVETGNPHAVRIYAHLLDQQNYWGKYRKQKYVFSQADLKKRLGYHETTKTADKAISKALEDLVNAGIIKYSKKLVHIDNGSHISATQKNQLNFIASEAKHLKK